MPNSWNNRIKEQIVAYFKNLNSYNMKLRCPSAVSIASEGRTQKQGLQGGGRGESKEGRKEEARKDRQGLNYQ